MKDITRSSVNISSKDQEKFKVFHKETKETTDMKELTEVREILEENRVEDQGGEQVGEKKQTAQTDPVRRPRTNAGFGVI